MSVPYTLINQLVAQRDTLERDLAEAKDSIVDLIVIIASLNRQVSLNKKGIEFAEIAQADKVAKLERERHKLAVLLWETEGLLRSTGQYAEHCDTILGSIKNLVS